RRVFPGELPSGAAFFVRHRRECGTAVSPADSSFRPIVAKPISHYNAAAFGAARRWHVIRRLRGTMCDRATGRQLDDPRTSGDTLAERARRGSGEAFGALMRLHGEAVYAIARNMSATIRDAEEVVQEAFLSAWRELSSFPAGDSFKTWLYGIAMKTALAHREAHRRNPWGSLEDLLPAFDGAGRLVETKGRWPELDGSPSEQIRVTGLLR